MLTEIRDRSSGWFAWIIAAIIIVPMAFFGIQQYAATDANPTIVEIGDQKISQAEYQSTLQQEQNRLRQTNPQLANADLFNSDFYKQQVLQSLINRGLTAHIADTNNYRVDEEKVTELIRNDPSFQTDGKFDPAVYQALSVTSPGGPEGIRNQVRTNARLRQVISGYSESAIVLPDEVRALLEIQTEKRTFDYIAIKQSDYRDQVTVSDAEIETYYQDNIDQFMEPDRLSVNYIELDKAQIAQEVIVDEVDLEAAYQDYQENFVSAETRDTRHILLSIGDDNADEQLAKAQELITQLRQGADFEALAKENSDDPGSAANGGSLGEVERGQMVSEFEEATFTLEAGVVSDPVKSQFGYHIIRVDNINATGAEPYEVIKPELEQQARDRQAEDLVLEQAEQLRNLLFEQADSLQPAADQLSLQIKSSPLFSAEQGSGIADNQSVRDAAFSDAVSQEGFNSELLEIADGVYVAISKKEFVESAPKPLAETSEQIKLTLTDNKASAAAEAAGDSIIERANNNWSDLQADESVSIETQTITMIDTDRKVPLEVSQEVMRLHLAEDESEKVSSFTSRNGDFNILRLTAIEAGDINAISEQVRNSTRSLIELRNGNALYEAYIDGLDEELNLEIKSDLL